VPSVFPGKPQRERFSGAKVGQWRSQPFAASALYLEGAIGEHPGRAAQLRESGKECCRGLNLHRAQRVGDAAGALGASLADTGPQLANARLDPLAFGLQFAEPIACIGRL
jgi:hypothetical protein